MSLLHRLALNLWYFRKPPWDSGITPPELFEFIKTHPAGRAIDLGCGTGTNVITLAKTGWQVTGIDLATGAIRQARQKSRQAGVEARFFTDDVTQLTHVSGVFELALDIGCFHGVDNKFAYLGQLQRILVPGGFWLVYGFFKIKENMPGFTQADLDHIAASNLNLRLRHDSLDKQARPSVWMLWQRAL